MDPHDKPVLPGGREPLSTEIDPVCGMLPHPATSYVERDGDGIERRFCSARCRAAFIAFPGMFGAAVVQADVEGVPQ